MKIEIQLNDYRGKPLEVKNEESKSRLSTTIATLINQNVRVRELAGTDVRTTIVWNKP